MGYRYGVSVLLGRVGYCFVVIVFFYFCFIYFGWGFKEFCELGISECF